MVFFQTYNYAPPYVGLPHIIQVKDEKCFNVTENSKLFYRHNTFKVICVLILELDIKSEAVFRKERLFCKQPQNGGKNLEEGVHRILRMTW